MSENYMDSFLDYLESTTPEQRLAARPDCFRCNYDMHRCKGCGEPLPHGTEVCPACA